MDKIGFFQRSEASKSEVDVAYYHELFTSSSPSSFSDLFEGFIPRVTEHMNDQLIKEVTTEGIKEVVFSVKASSGPGADGMTGLFLQRYWGIIGHQVTLAVKDFFCERLFPGGLELHSHVPLS